MSLLDSLQFDWGSLGGGTRFRLFPQPPEVTGWTEPEVVSVSLPPGAVGPGPADDRIYVADAVSKPRYYEYPYLPPYAGDVNPPARPGPDGHFDHIPLATPEFESAHVYGAVRRVLDIWEVYFGRRIPWHFAEVYDRLELVPWIDWNNAQAGFGFIETGYRTNASGERIPLCLNFDVLAHEFGHTLLYSEIGMPTDGARTSFLAGFHESASDCVAIVSTLHFDSIVDLLLERTRGNLYVTNLLNRIGEIAPTEQIRLAGNRLRMSDVPDTRTPPDALSHKALHRIGEPLTGAVFDVLVEVYQQLLVEDGLIGRALDAASRRGGRGADAVQAQFDAAYAADPAGFRRRLLDARDYMGAVLAATWGSLDWRLSFAGVGRALLEADQRLSGGHFHPEIRESLAWREILH